MYRVLISGLLGFNGRSFDHGSHESEDGRVPKTLVERGLRRMNRLLQEGLSEGALAQELNKMTCQRQHVVKWLRDTDREDRFNISSEYDWLLEDLQPFFSFVSILRVPRAQDLHWFQRSLCVLHQEAGRIAGEVQKAKQKLGVCFSDRESGLLVRNLT